MAERLAQHAATAEDFQVLTQFATWRLRADLAARAEHRVLSEGQLSNATQRLRVAGSLLAWLAGRGSSLAGCTQADLDTWFATPPSTHVHANPFLLWAMATRRAPKLELSQGRFGNAPVLGHDQRLEILRRLLDPSTGHLEHRVAAMMLVLLDQPFNRIAALALTDVEVGDGGVNVRLAHGAVPIPPPFAAMVTELVARRPNLNTAANPTSPFLFPGRKADKHLRPATLRVRSFPWGSISWVRGAARCANSCWNARRRSLLQRSDTATRR
ncbi:MAG TPA: hypothetical protein VGR26_05090 [Acidimicrobiales bacterium]|nr:hypothetical protein [Acidimicrobiales bacterium]